MKSTKKILAIGLDAAEPSLIERWMNEGYLKNLASLRLKGTYGRLNSSADWLVGSTWPTFHTSTLAGKHGFYHYLQWNSDKMDYERPNPEWIPATPFYRLLDNNCKVIAVDMPLTYPPKTFNGIEISGWALHDRIYPISSFPKEKINWVIKNFGKPPISDEVGGLQEMTDLLKLKDELINANKKEAELVTALIKDEEWNLFLCCFSSTHRGGHKFWEPTNIKGDFSEEQKIQFDNALRDIYQSCDEAIGKIINCTSKEATILIFSLHGMGVNTTLADKILLQMIARILNGKAESEKIKSDNFIKKLRNAVPLEWRSNFRKFLPFWLQDKMTAYWRMGKVDWTTTKVFNLVADLQGYIRINLKGREKEGIVEQGEEYDWLCNKVIEGLKTFKDANNFEPVVESISRSDQIFYKGNGFNNLPDIIVKWKFKPAVSYKKIISSEYGELEWPSPGINPDGRSGNHRPEGFLLAAGKNIKINSTFEKKHIVDLAPTILHLLGVSVLEDYDGKVIEDIL
ncbi:MAG: alkaline phosphatase family protein [Ignavibacteria bacterium]|nr:alkaline phosphatase family protein [Ignavibacteria bacterium]